MKRIFAGCLVLLLFCCGCDAGGKPEPLHLDDGLAGLLPGAEGTAPASTSRPTGSDVLDQLLGLQEGLTVPEIPGFDAAELYREYLEIKAEIEKVKTDKNADRAALLTKIGQLRDLLSLMKVQAGSALSEGKITQEQLDALAAFLDALDGDLAEKLDDLK